MTPADEIEAAVAKQPMYAWVIEHGSHYVPRHFVVIGTREDARSKARELSADEYLQPRVDGPYNYYARLHDERTELLTKLESVTEACDVEYGRARNAQEHLSQCLEALKTTAGNIRSLGPAGAIKSYEVWLRVVEQAIVPPWERDT